MMVRFLTRSFGSRSVIGVTSVKFIEYIVKWDKQIVWECHTIVKRVKHGI